MEVFEAIQTRRSIRKYLDVPVEWDKIGTILEAGRLAPSAGNVQEWKFIVVTDPAIRKKIAEAAISQMWMESAPVYIVIVSVMEKIRKIYGVRGERLYTIQDCAIAATQMMLVANSLGLGTCWVGAFDENLIQKAIGLPDDVRPQIVLTIGYPDEQPRPLYRYSLEHVTLLNGYGGSAYRMKDIGMVLWDYNVVGRGVQAAKDAVTDVKKTTKKQRESLFDTFHKAVKNTADKLKSGKSP